MVLEAEERRGVGDAGHRLDAVAEVDSDQSRGDDAEGEQPLEDAGALSAAGGGEALGEVERDHNADEAAADALEQAAEEERAVTLREGDDRDAKDEGDTAEDHERLAAHPVGEHAGEERGEDAAQQHGGDDDGELSGGESGGGFQIRERAADDAHVDAVEQTAEAGNREEKGVVAAEGGFRGGCGRER